MQSACTLQTILSALRPAFLARVALPLYLHTALRAMSQCRTAALGGHVKACPQGHVQRAWYNSCRHRACPQCAYIQAERWLERKRRDLLPCDHFHLTFTLPSQLHELWRYNREPMAKCLFAAARDTLVDLLDDPRWLGAKPGVLMALHTWSRTLTLHPHVHCLVTAGGLDNHDNWAQPKRPDILLPTDVARIVFKAKLRDRLAPIIRRDELNLPPDMNSNDALWTLERAMRRKWVVDRRERYRHGKGVATYLARYIRGGPVLDRGLLAFDGHHITLRKSRRGEPRQDIDLDANDFVWRILQHVPPPRSRVVRAYGLYAPNQRPERERARQLLGGEPLPLEPEARAEIPRKPIEGETEDVYWIVTGDGPPEEYCKVCGSLLVTLETISRTPEPLPSHLGGRAPP